MADLGLLYNVNQIKTMNKIKSKLARFLGLLFGAPALLFASVAIAQTSTTTPGTPTTGAGGNMLLNLVVLALAALIVAGGVAYAYKERV